MTETTEFAAQPAEFSAAELAEICDAIDARKIAERAVAEAAPVVCTATCCNAPLPARAHRVSRRNADWRIAPRDERTCWDCKVADVIRKRDEIYAPENEGVHGPNGRARAWKMANRELARLGA